MKVVNIVFGISSYTSMHGCPYCEGFKVDDKTGEKPTKRGGIRLGCLERKVILLKTNLYGMNKLKVIENFSKTI